MLARRYTDTQICRYADRCSCHGFQSIACEDVVGFADHPHPRRLSKLSLKYWHNKHQLKQESMPVIPVNPNHPAASAACKRMPSAAIHETPPRAAKTRANNALLHGASASAPRCHDVASVVAAASVLTDAGNATGLGDAHAVTDVAAAGSVALPARSVNSSNSSDSDDLDMIGEGCTAFGWQSTPSRPGKIIFQWMGMMLTRIICPLMQEQVSTLFWILSSITWSRR